MSFAQGKYIIHADIYVWETVIVISSASDFPTNHTSVYYQYLFGILLFMMKLPKYGAIYSTCKFVIVSIFE